MSNSVVSLALFDGFWGQVFEYWPLSLLVALTIVYVTIALGSDVIFNRLRKGPPSAAPRVEIEIDPSVHARNRFRTGLTLIRLGVVVGVVMAGVFAYVGHNPLSIGADYGLTQATDDATALGTRFGLAAAAIAVLATLWVRVLPLVLIGVIDLSLIAIPLAPPVFNGQLASLGLTAFLMSISLALAAIGTGFALANYSEAFRPKNAAQDAEPAQVR